MLDMALVLNKTVKRYGPSHWFELTTNFINKYVDDNNIIADDPCKLTKFGKIFYIFVQNNNLKINKKKTFVFLIGEKDPNNLQNT